jgi:hypothetical protein
LTAVGLLLAVLSTGPPAGAQESDPIQLKAVRGTFPPFLVRDRWTQQSAVLENRTGEAIRLRVLVGTVAEGRTLRYGRVVTVPAGLRRTTQFAYRPRTLDVLKTGRNRRGAASAELPVMLLREETSQRLLQRSERVQVLAPGGHLGLAIGPLDGNSYSYLPEAFRRGQTEPRTLSTGVTGLPDVWYGYDSLAVLFLSGTSPDTIRPSQVEALLQWVRTGGVLVLTGRDELPVLLAGPLGEAAGVAGLETMNVDRLRLANHDGQQAGLRLPRPMPMTELCALDAEVLQTANGLPLLTRRRLGQGWIFTLAVPLGAVSQPAAVRLWSDVVDAVRQLESIEPDRFEEPGWQTLQQIAGRRGPLPWVPLTVLLGLAGGTLLVGLGLGLKRRGELLWVALVPIALLTSFVLWSVQESRLDPPRLTHVGLASAVGPETMDLREQFVYYTGPEAGRVDFVSGSPRAVLQDLGGRGASPDSVRVLLTAEDGMRTDERTLPPGDTRGAGIRTFRWGLALDADLTFDADGLAGSVRNSLHADLRDAVLYLHRTSYRLGTLPAGQETPVRVSASDRLGPGEFSSGVIPNRLRDALLQRMIPESAFGVDIQPRPMLVGYVLRSFTDPLGGRDLQRQGWTIVLRPVRFAPPRPGSAVTIPAGMTEVEFTSLRTPVWNAQKQQFIQTIRPSDLLVRAGPPGSIGRLRDVTAEVTVDIQASSHRLVVYGVRRVDGRKVPASARVELAAYDNPAGRRTCSVPRADRFLGPDGRIQLLLSVQAGGRIKRQALLNAAATWSFESVSVGLKGTME